MKTYKVMAALLSYPERELIEAVAELRQALDAEGMLAPGERRALDTLFDALAGIDLMALQESYVGLFDRVRSLSLHLFEHVHGESRDRGQALVELKSLYERRGLEMRANELPDYLPAFLEFLSLLPKEEARSLLADSAHILEAIGARLAKRRSPYAAVFRALVALSGEDVGATVVDDAEIRKEDDPATLDTGYETYVSVADGPQPGSGDPDSQRSGAMSYVNYFFFGIYPYVALAVFLVGSLIRFDREQFTWKSDSSQLLKRGQLRLGSNLFHIGILALFFGHLFGLLTPPGLYHALGLSTAAKQTLAITAGGFFGLMCLVGLVLLIHRRLTEARIRANSSRMDFVILWWILATLALGLASIIVSLGHMDGSVMLVLGEWARYIVTFRGGAADFVAPVHWLYKVHLFFGMTVFVLFPFSRLVHVWSGFGALAYLTRAYQVVRSRG